jgi:hypothetical protein
MRRLVAVLACLTLTVALVPATALAAVPSNDNLADAAVLTGTSGSVTGDTTEATVETSEWFYGSHSVWYTWSNSGRKAVAASFTTCSGATYDTILDVTSAEIAAPGYADLIGVAGNDDACGSLQSKVTFIAQPGVTYWIRLAGYQSFSYGPFTLEWSTASLISGSLSLTLTNTAKDPTTCTLTVKSVGLLEGQDFALVKGEAASYWTTAAGRWSDSLTLDKTLWSLSAPGDMFMDPSTVVSADGASPVTPKIVNRCK